jgi:hypothetical protein
MKADTPNLTLNIIRAERVGDVLVIEINNPPINAGSLTVSLLIPPAFKTSGVGHNRNRFRGSSQKSIQLNLCVLD